MENAFKRYFSLEAYAGAVERQRASNLYLALSLLLITVVAGGLLGLVVGQDGPGVGLIATTVAATAILATLDMTRRGYKDAAFAVFAGVMLLISEANLLTAEDASLGLFQGITVWLVLIIGGLVLPARGILILGTASALMFILGYSLNTDVDVPADTTLEGWLITLLIVTGFFTSIAWLIARNMAAVSLSTRVEETSRRLLLTQTSSAVSKQIFTRLDLEELLTETVESIRLNFPDIYHAQVFLIDESGKEAYLRASTGEVGKALIARKHRLSVGSVSVIGRVTQSGEPVLVSDTSADPVHKVNELLPDTLTELAIPLRGREGIIGALDVQSKQRNAFTQEDVDVLQVLADQIAIAIDNATLFQSVQQEVERARALAEASQLTGQITGDTSRGLAELFRTLAKPGNYTEWWLGLLQPDGETLTRVTGFASSTTNSLLPEKLTVNGSKSAITEAIRSRQMVVVNDFDSHPVLGKVALEQRQMFGKHIAAPIVSALDKNRILGVALVGRPDSMSDLNERDIELIASLTSQVSVALENQRLFTQVAEEQQRLQSVLAATPTGIVVTDQHDTIILANEQARMLLGIDIGGKLQSGYPIVRSASGLPYPPLELPSHLALEQGRTIVVEDLSIQRQQKAPVNLLSQAAPILDEQGRVNAVVSIYQDITELRALEHALQDSLSETTRLYEASRAIASVRDVQSIAQVLIELLLALTPEKVFVTLYRELRRGRMEVDFIGAWPEPITSLDESGLPPALLMPGVALNANSLSLTPQTLGETLRLPESQIQALQAAGVATLIFLPLEARGKVLGSIVTTFSTERNFEAEERRFLLTLADQASVALNSLLLVEDLQKSLENTDVLFRASRSLAETQDVNEALEVVLRFLQQEDPDRVDVVLARDENEFEHLYHALNWSKEPELADVPAIPLDGVSSFDLITLQEYFIEDISTSNLSFAQALRAQGVYGAVASLPFRAAGQPNGRLSVGFKQPRVFAEEERQFMRLLADSAAYVIESDVLFRQTQDSLEETGILYQAIRAFASAEDNGGILQAIIDYAADPIVDKALLFSLLTPSWEDEEALIEVTVSWVRGEAVDLTGMRFTPEQFPSWQQISSQEIIWVDDVMNSEQVNEVAQMGYMALDIGSFAIIPLAVSGRPIGAILLGASQPRVHREREIRIYQSLADQAAVTLENKRLYADAGRRARQLATSAQVSQAVSSILDLEELMPQMVDLIKDAFDYDHAQIFLVSEDGQHAELKASTGEAGRQLLAIRHSLPVGSRSVIGAVTSTGKPTIALDTSDARVVHKPNPYLPNTRSEMAIPLIAKGRILGALDVQSNEPGAFTDADVRILEVLADQLAVAIENAQLFDSAGKRSEEMAFLFNVTAESTRAENLDGVLDRISHLLLEQMQATLVVAYLLLDEAGRLEVESVAIADNSLTRSDVPDIDITDRDFAAIAVRRREAFVIPDNNREMVYKPIVPGMNSSIYVPLMSGEKPIGLLRLESDRLNRFDENTQRVMQALTGSVTAIIQNYRLLADLQNANEQLREVDQLKTNFLAAMSHELRTPLNSIIGFSRVILKGIDGPITDMQQQDLQTIHDSGKHLLGLVNDILDQAKIDAGKMELAKEYFDIKPVIKGVMSSAEGLTKEKPIRLYTEIENELPNAFGDEFRTRQIILNLLSNAAKFTEKGSITTSVHTIMERGRRYVQVSVTDTGIGIRQKDFNKLFEAFQQVDNSTTRTQQGTGLGLPLAKSLVELQGGRIWVESEYGVGSTFSITIPIEPLEEENKAQEAPVAEPSTNGQSAPTPYVIPAPPKLVLVVDEDVDVINLYRRYLNNEGYDVVGITRLDELQEMSGRYNFHVVVLDVNIENGKGWESLNYLTNTANIPVIVCSMNDEVKESRQAGAVNHLVKPFAPDDLVKAVQKVEARVS